MQSSPSQMHTSQPPQTSMPQQQFDFDSLSLFSLSLFSLSLSVSLSCARISLSGCRPHASSTVP